MSVNLGQAAMRSSSVALRHQKRVNRHSAQLGLWTLTATLFALLQLAGAQQPFLDCRGKLGGYLDDGSALTFVKDVHEAKQFKFSSECLEILLKKNFVRAADFLLEQYYPKTAIDTEIIVRSVASDVKRQQDYVLYRLMKAREDKLRKFKSDVPEFPPRVTPMLYQA